MAFLRALPPSVHIYTNEPGAVYLYTGRGAYVLPDRFDPVTAEARNGFEQGVGQMQTEIKSGRRGAGFVRRQRHISRRCTVIKQGIVPGSQIGR